MPSDKEPLSRQRGVRSHAKRLLETFFASDDERTRRTVFNAAFGDCEPNPVREIDWSGSVAVFADHAVEKLLAFGCAGRGRHCLSLLLATMAEIRGRQTDPDFYDLPPLLDADCALPTRDEERRYLERLLKEIEEKARLYSPLYSIAEIRPDRPADALLHAWRDDPDLALLRHRSREHEVPTKAEPRDYDDILTAFGEVKQAALLGAPGAGKSTTLRKLAVELAQRAMANPHEPLPLLASLGDWRGDESLPQFLDERIPEIGWAVQALNGTSRLVLLLDGLNEVPTAKRASKAADVLALKDELAEGTPIFVSCRADDYAGDLDLQFDTLSLEPLSPQRVRAALRQWVTNVGEGPEVAERLFWQLAGDELAGVMETWLAAGATEDAFWSVTDPRDDKKAYAKTSGEENRIWRRHVPDPRSLLRLAANPFMLTMLYQVWAFEGELPRNRGDLFKRFIDRLLSREGLLVKEPETGVWQRTPDGERLLAGLADLAWDMQGERIDAGQLDAGDFGVLTVVSRDAAVGSLGGAALLKKAQDCTLLEGGDEIRFRHQLLQEYFTAQALKGRIDRTGAAEFWPPERWWERSGWEESCVLLAGFYSDDCTPVIRWLADAQPEVAAQCILESGAEVAERNALLKDLHDAWLPRLTSIEREPEPEGRAAIGRALGRLGLDRRTGVALTQDDLPDIDWVEILGGEFLYQDGERRQIKGFFIARYPLTNVQFQAFLDAEDGYENDRWWKGLTRPTRSHQPPRWDESNHPRETVSWHEAVAFCAWLGHKLGLNVGLPTEWQWERAARGVDGRAYPWGGGDQYRAGHANIDETRDDAGRHYLAQTTAVGLYPQGASPEGVLDLSGNVWEWCLNEYENPERTQPGGEGSRVVRGGSWFSFRGRVRAVYRFDYHPGGRGRDVGFRVGCSSPIH